MIQKISFQTSLVLVHLMFFNLTHCDTALLCVFVRVCVWGWGEVELGNMHLKNKKIVITLKFHCLICRPKEQYCSFNVDKYCKLIPFFNYNLRSTTIDTCLVFKYLKINLIISFISRYQ